MTAAKTMAEVLREKFAGERSTGKIWATPEEILAALTAAGFGLVVDAKVEALEEAAAELERLIEIGKTPYDQIDLADKEAYRDSNPGGHKSDWLRARAAALRGQG